MYVLDLAFVFVLVFGVGHISSFYQQRKQKGSVQRQKKVNAVRVSILCLFLSLSLSLSLPFSLSPSLSASMVFDLCSLVFGLGS